MYVVVEEMVGEEKRENVTIHHGRNERGSMFLFKKVPKGQSPFPQGRGIFRGMINLDLWG
jgi:hypothetical protein